MTTKRLAFLGLWFAASLSALCQVVPTTEIPDPALRALQQKSLLKLSSVAKEIRSYNFDHDFYCTRQLDIDEDKERRADQHSIRFERFKGATVLAISGNYYGAYSDLNFSQEQRAERTFSSVVLPLAKAAVPEFANNEAVQGFAFEISHHVLSHSMGELIERPENIVVFLPRAAAIKLVTATDLPSEQAALLDGQVFVNANPITLWLQAEPRSSSTGAHILKASAPTSMPGLVAAATPPGVAPLPDAPLPPAPAVRSAVFTTKAAEPPTDPPSVSSPPPPPAAAPVPPPMRSATRGVSSAVLRQLQDTDQTINDRLVRDLGKQAHFAQIAPPTFIAFRNQTYLQLSLQTRLSETSSASRYKLAALAFEDHIAPLNRQVLSYYLDHHEFDGITFSTSVSTTPRQGPASKPISVEFFLPLDALRSFESYDLTSQQLLDRGVVLINGERVGLDLEEAEADRR